MLTSGQIAAMMAQQQQNFASAAGYSQAISAQLPPTFNAGGIGAYGAGGYGVQQFPQIPYAPISRPGFSYANAGAGYGTGSQIGGMAAAGAAGGMLAGVGLAGMIPGVGRMFDPFHGAWSAGSAAMSAGRGIGGVFGAGLMGALPGIGVGMAASYVGSQIAYGAQEQMGVNSALGSFNFSNPMSRSGRGFSRNDAMAIGDMAREMAVLPELRTSMSEITRIMERLNSTGMMNGVRNAQDYANRFKQTMGELKDIARIMGTTKEEAVAFLQQSHQSGAYSSAAVHQHMMRTQSTMAMTGMNAQQAMALSAQGAQMSFAMGGTRLTGSRSIQRIAGELGTANRMGLLSNEQLMEMTGMEGPEAIAALSGTVNQIGYRMGQSSLGTAMTLALGEVKNGQYTGRMDEGLSQRFREGGITKDELLKMARQRVHSGGRQSMLSYAAHKNKLRAEMVGSVGAQGIVMELQGIMGEHGWESPNAVNLVMRRYGVDERNAEMIVELGKNMSNVQGEMAIVSRNESRRVSEQAFLQENYSWDAVKHKVGLRWDKAISEPLKKMGARLSNAVAEYVDDFEDDIFGRYQAEITQHAASVISRAAIGDRASMQLLSQAGAPRSMGADLSQQGGFLRRSASSLISGLTGDKSLGEQQQWMLSHLGSGLTQTAYSGQKINSMREQGMTLLSTSLDGQRGVLTSDDQLKEGARRLLEGGNVPGLSDYLSSAAGQALVQQFRTDVIGQSNDLKNIADPQKRLEEAMHKNFNLVWKAKGNLRLAADDNSQNLNIFTGIARAAGVSNYKALGIRDSAALLNPEQASSIPELARAIKKDVSSLKGAFGDQASSIPDLLRDGDAGALLQTALSNTEEGRALFDALQDGKVTDKVRGVLGNLSISEKSFEALRDRVGSAASAADMSKKVTIGGKEMSLSEGILAIRQNQVRQGRMMSQEDLKASRARMSTALSDYSSELGGVKSKAGLDALNRIRGLASATGGQDVAGEVEAGLALADASRGDIGAISKVASPEVLLAQQAALGIRKKFGKGRRDKYGDRSLASLGFTHDELAKTFANEGDIETIMRQAQSIAGGDGRGGVHSGAEERALEKLMATSRANHAVLNPRGEAGTTLGAPPTDKSITELGKNVGIFASQMGELTTALKGLAGG